MYEGQRELKQLQQQIQIQTGEKPETENSQKLKKSAFTMKIY